MDKCEHKGCQKTNPPYTLYDAGKGKFCAEHFGGAENAHRQATTPKKGKRK